MAKHRGLVPVALPNRPRHPGSGGPGGGFLYGQVFGQGARAASGGVGETDNPGIRRIPQSAYNKSQSSFPISLVWWAFPLLTQSNTVGWI